MVCVGFWPWGECWRTVQCYWGAVGGHRGVAGSCWGVAGGRHSDGVLVASGGVLVVSGGVLVVNSGFLVVLWCVAGAFPVAGFCMDCWTIDAGGLFFSLGL